MELEPGVKHKAEYKCMRHGHSQSFSDGIVFSREPGKKNKRFLCSNLERMQGLCAGAYGRNGFKLKNLKQIPGF